MSARIDICNLALSWLGANQITSIEDDSDEARLLKANYYLARDAVLEAHEWSFAIRRFTPARLTEDPDWGVEYQFTIPSDIIRVLRVVRAGQSGGGDVYSVRQIDRGMEADWVAETGLILTNEAAIECKGLRKIEDEGIYSPLFCHALAAQLAMLCALSLTQSMEIHNAMGGLWSRKIHEAKTRDGLQGSPKRLRNRSLRNVR